MGAIQPATEKSHRQVDDVRNVGRFDRSNDEERREATAPSPQTTNAATPDRTSAAAHSRSRLNHARRSTVSPTL